MNNEVTLRDATWDDVASLTLLMNDLSYPTTLEEMQARFKPILAHPEYKTILAVLNDTVVGMAGLHKGNFYEKNGMYLRVLAFVVKQNVRKMGIGSILIKALEDWAAQQNLNEIIINSGNRDDRKAAHIFYQRMGYAIKSSGFVKYL